MDNITKKKHYDRYILLQNKPKKTKKDLILINHYKTLEGGGFFDSIKSLISSGVNKAKQIFSSAPRQGFSDADEKVLQQLGSRQITEIKIVRTPIASWINSIIKWGSGGKFQQQAQARGYDDLFHLYALIFVENFQKPILYEKNSTPRLTLDIPQDKYINADTQVIQIPIPRTLSLATFINQAIGYMGQDYWKYSMGQFNCQDFISRSLQASGLLTDYSKKWIVQDVLDIGKTLPSLLQRGFQGLTDLDAWGRKVLGKGLEL